MVDPRFSLGLLDLIARGRRFSGGAAARRIDSRAAWATRAFHGDIIRSGSLAGYRNDVCGRVTVAMIVPVAECAGTPTSR
jgi:hypothetical protein